MCFDQRKVKLDLSSKSVWYLKPFLVTSSCNVCQCTQNWFRLFYYSKQCLNVCSWKVFKKIHLNKMKNKRIWISVFENDFYYNWSYIPSKYESGHHVRICCSKSEKIEYQSNDWSFFAICLFSLICLISVEQI